MRSFTFTAVFAGPGWSVSMVASFFDACITGDEKEPAVLGVERFDTSTRHALDIGALHDEYRLESTAYNVTVAEGDVQVIAECFGKSVDEFEQKFFGEWRETPNPDRPYISYYTSQDVAFGADGTLQAAPTWSVYSELYPYADAAEPIDGTQRYVSRHMDEGSADREVDRLFRMTARR